MKILIIFCLTAASGSMTIGSAAEARLSPAEYSLAEARTAIASKPGDAGAFNALAMALVRRARETSDDSFYGQADAAVRKSLELSPANFEARKMKVLVLLGQHDYSAALSEAQVLNKKVADDVMVYGLLTDAYSALGDYKNAEISAQWMLNLRPGNVPAFIHAAQLREVFGEFNGAYEALDLAYQGTSPTEYTDRAALLTNMGRERRLAGNADDAEKLIKQALDLYPGAPSSLRELSRVYLDEKRMDDAVAVLRQLCKAVPSAENSFQLAEALELAGRAEEARAIYSAFLPEAISKSAEKNNLNLDLAFYYADHAHQPAKALEVAKREYSGRHDIFTLDAYAWALHVNGQDQEARKQIDLALAVGTRDPKILAHSQSIRDSGSSSATLR